MARAIKNWTGLDNAAKIFPPSQSAGDTKVFRVTCELAQDVDKAHLENALAQTVQDFPGFMRTIRRGAFWYYLEECDALPPVHEEEDTPCSPMRFGQSTPLFDVSYYKCRIHLEIYHSLTDGTGALQFLRVLVANYLRLAHPQALKDAPEAAHFDPEEAMDDSFRRYYDDNQKADSVKEPNAYRLWGLRRDDWALGVIEGKVSTAQMLERARAHGCKMTMYMAALYILAIGKTMIVRQRKKPVIVTVPVNLRAYFDSRTTRNFFSVINVGYTFEKGVEPSLGDVIAALQSQFVPAATQENMYRRLNNLSALENKLALRLIPLRIKDWVMRLFYEGAEKKFTVSLTNLGNVQMPEAYTPYIRAFQCLVSTKKLQIGACSFGDDMRICFTSSYQSVSVERNFFRMLAMDGVEVAVTGNRREEDADENL